MEIEDIVLKIEEAIDTKQKYCHMKMPLKLSQLFGDKYGEKVRVVYKWRFFCRIL